MTNPRSFCVKEFPGILECSKWPPWPTRRTNELSDHSYVQYMKGERRQSTNYMGISLLNLPKKVHSDCYRKIPRDNWTYKLVNAQCVFILVLVNDRGNH